MQWQLLHQLHFLQPLGLQHRLLLLPSAELLLFRQMSELLLLLEQMFREYEAF